MSSTASASGVIPLGFCQCGCGEKTKLTTMKSSRYGYEKGQPRKFVVGHHTRIRLGEKSNAWKGGRINDERYFRIMQPDHPRATPDGYVYEHVLIAERALGKFLPPQAEVHHVSEIKSDNRNNNLVICQDHTYHLLLHVRMRALKACGNPNWRKCQFCKQWDDPSKVIGNPYNASVSHPDCRKLDRQLRHKKLLTA